MNEIIASALRTTSPILLAALGGLIVARAGMFKLSLEGTMLMGAFFAVVGLNATGNIWFGLVAASVAGVCVSLVFGIASLFLHANEIIVGLAINIACLGLTSTMLVTLLNSQGSFTAQGMSGLPVLNLPFVKHDGALNSALGGQTILVYLSFLLVPAVAYFFKNTRTGISMRAVGENSEAAQSNGIRVQLNKFLALALCGVLCGLAGAQLSTGILQNTFSENMTQGRGYLAFTAVVIGGAWPLRVLGGSALLGGTMVLGTVLQLWEIPFPPEAILASPFVLTILVMSVESFRRKRRSGADFALDEMALYDRPS